MLISSKSNYGSVIRRKQTLRTFVLLILLAFILVSIVALFSIQRSRSARDQKDLIRLWQSEDYRSVFDQSAKDLEKKPMDYFLLSLHGFSAYQLAVAQINQENMLIYLDQCIWALRNALLSKDKKQIGRIYYVLGKAYFSKGSDFSDLAIQYLEAAKQEYFKASDIPEHLGLAYADVKDYRNSVIAFSEALVPEDGEDGGKMGAANDALLLAIAKSYIELDELDTAGAYLARCLDVSKDFNTIAVAKLLYGNILLKKGNYAEAEKQFLAVLKEGGERADAHFQLGELYAAREENTRARAEWRKAWYIDPAYTPAIARLNMK
ncbi:MAG: tetratricopeptide repeat protein [Termitinemataceae bacterium]|nr:MAG: tetratricopeptide repeat protein [Termitinemataceae bacterium]